MCGAEHNAPQGNTEWKKEEWTKLCKACPQFSAGVLNKVATGESKPKLNLYTDLQIENGLIIHYMSLMQVKRIGKGKGNKGILT